MSNTKNAGGPAFPMTLQHVTDAGIWPETVPGMDLRDYFAAKAGDADIAAALAADEYEHNSVDRTLARFRHADNMLKAREQ
ncbi:MAG: hypothetical protein E6Q97_10975 [Desulfurellales bacterium]|nr:MAG: hypothetical protein E6Q97_10975 [Desulfurellales bacterium]